MGTPYPYPESNPYVPSSSQDPLSRPILQGSRKRRLSSDSLPDSETHGRGDGHIFRAPFLPRLDYSPLTMSLDIPSTVLQKLSDSIFRQVNWSKVASDVTPDQPLFYCYQIILNIHPARIYELKQAEEKAGNPDKKYLEKSSANRYDDPGTQILRPVSFRNEMGVADDDMVVD